MANWEKDYTVALATTAVDAGLAVLMSRPEQSPLADHILDVLSEKWHETRRILVKRIAAGDRGEELDKPNSIILALSDLHSFAVGAMWAYMCIEGTANIAGDEKALAAFRRMLAEGPRS